MRVLDLFSGMGGFSQAFRDRGHQVITVDIDRSFKPSIVADVRNVHFNETEFDVVLASPPCMEFSRASMPWLQRSDTLKSAINLVKETVRIINEAKPKFWILENVRGSVPYISKILGPYKKRCGSRYLFGNFPIFYCDHKKCFGKSRLFPSTGRSAVRAKIPYEISLNLCISIENMVNSDDEPVAFALINKNIEVAVNE